MNVNININDTSETMDFNTEEAAGHTGFVPDAGTPPEDLDPSASENPDPSDDATASESDSLDIGGPAEWLVEAMANASFEEEDEASNESATDSIDDGGSGPSE